MKNLSIASIIQKNKLAGDQPWLVALEVQARNPVTGIIDSTIRIVRNDEDVTIDGQTFLAMPFEMTFEETLDGMPSVNVVIQDQTQTVQAYMQSYAGGAGFPVKLIVVTGDDKDALTSEADLVEYFEVITGSADSANYTATWQLGVENPLAIGFPRRRQYTDQCSFRFKSVECGYTGAAERCDLTLDGANGCKVKANENRYGGFPGLVSRT